MGYAISQIDASFHMKKENFDKCLDIAMKMFEHTDKLSWTEKKDVQEAYKLKDVWMLFGAWRYEVHFNGETGDIEDVEFFGGKVGAEEKFFSAIAPCVEDGSFIEMRGEGGERWRWSFNDGVMAEITPKITWE